MSALEPRSSKPDRSHPSPSSSASGLFWHASRSADCGISIVTSWSSSSVPVWLYSKAAENAARQSSETDSSMFSLLLRNEETKSGEISLYTRVQLSNAPRRYARSPLNSLKKFIVSKVTQVSWQTHVQLGFIVHCTSHRRGVGCLKSHFVRQNWPKSCA